MATNNNDLRDANDLLREQLELLRQVNELQQNSYDASAAAVDSIKEALGINSRRSTFENSTLKVNKSIAQSILDQKTGLRDLESISRQISKNQELLNKARVIENGLTNRMAGADLTRLNNFIEVYQGQQDLLEYLESAHNLSLSEVQALEQQIRNNDHILDQLSQQMDVQELQLAYTKLNTSELEKQQTLREGEENIQKKLEAQLGLAGKMAKTLGHFRGITDDVNKALADTTEEMQHIATEEGRILNKWQTFGLLVSKLGSNLASHLNDPLVVITTMVKVLKDVDKGAGDFAKSMNISYDAALNVRGEMNAMAMSSRDVALNSERLQESLGYINQQLGTNGKLSEQDLKVFTKLREQSGLTNEQLFSMQKYTMATGGTLKENISTFQATSKILSYQNKVSLNTKQLMVDMGSVSNRTKLSIEGGAAGLAKAAFNAKLMGSNLEQISSIADQLLNFESSIEAELSAELLTGKDITLEKARQAALNNDLATVASEITRQVGSAAAYGDMNRIQQEAMAKAVGMTADQLADVLFEQEAIRAVGGLLSDEEKRAFETAKDKYGLELASKMLKDGQLDALVDQQSIQDRFNDSILKLKDIFVSLAVPALQIVSPFADLVGYLASSKEMLSAIAGLFVGMKVFQIWSLAAKQRELAIEAEILAIKTGQAVASSVINPFAAAAGLIAGAATAALVYSSMKGNDVVSAGEGTGYGNRTLLMGKDAIQLNNKDTVIAGTNLFGGKQNQSTTVDNSSLIAEIRALRNEMNSRPVVVHSTVQLPNGEALARATNSENRKIHYGVQ
jgi:hypothetical protein